MEPQALKGEAKPAQFTKEELNLLYEEALYTFLHRSGKPSASHIADKEELLHYLKNAFQMDQEEHKVILEQVKQLKPPNAFLKITVKEARGLLAKDANGFSDPYCLLGVVITEGQQDEEANRADSPLPRRRQKAVVKDSIPQDQIQRTEVKKQTLNPVWNETFLLKVEDYRHTELHMDMWDLDVDDPVKLRLGEIHGIVGLKRVFKDVKKAARKNEQDDFLGNVIIKLQDLSYTPEDEWYPLEPRTETYPDRGKCHLQLRVIHEERETTLSKQKPVFWIHRSLLQQFVQYDRVQRQAEALQPEMELSIPATTILSLHATQNDLSPFQQDLAKWLAYSKLYRHVEVTATSLLQHLTSIEYQWGLAQVTLQQQDQDELAKSFMSFLDYGISILQKYRDVFPMTDPKSAEHQQSLLRVLEQICKMKAFHKLCPSVPDLCDRLMDALKAGNIEWYQSHKQLLEPMIKTEEEIVKSLVIFIEQLNIDLLDSRKTRSKIYTGTIKADLFSIAYRQFLELVAEDLQEQVANIRGGKSKATVEGLFQLYQKLKQLQHQRIYLLPDKGDLPLDDFHKWFREPLPKWLQMVYNNSVEMVQRAVKKDQLESMGEKTKHSTSAVDIATCFTKIKHTWTELSWPEPEEAFVIMVKLTEDVGKIALMYCRLIEERAEELSFKDYRVNSSDSISGVRSLQLCVVLNNMKQLREVISKLPEDLDWQGLKEETANMISGDQIQHTLLTQLETINSSINKKIEGVIQTLAQKLQADIKKHIDNLSHPSIANISVVNMEFLPLIEFLKNEFAYMDTNLVEENFQSLLGFLWTDILQIVYSTSHQGDVSPRFYMKLKDALRHLLTCFHGEGNGLPLEQLQTPGFKDLKAHLSLNAASTHKLIQKFYAKKIQQQTANECSKYGAVTIKVFYDNQVKRLHVEILNAVNLIALDSNGTSDPFVELTLEPKHIFPMVESKTTQRKDNDLNPLFDEVFEFSDVIPEQCRSKGACLLITVFDHDTLLSDDLEGEAYFSLQDIPGLDSTEEALNISKVPQSRLMLGHPKPRDKILKLLEARRGDKDAQAFIKIRRQRERKSMET
ncbi:protein unc-13 homolog D isoform X2 [Scyliorhinus canicula]|uniref:protein unc-13 homolog D isoform X2 n=1 Tax=Scyliorhinus canicula TaxID=7830 RepID=UPI0018F2E3A8|nr:protein unc-13 homolog D isoform X2 [Scyliorhinus canicula]